MCSKDKTWEERVEGAETLAYLIEVDTGLQRIAAVSDHIIITLADYFRYPGSPPDVTLMPTKKVQTTRNQYYRIGCNKHPGRLEM